MRTGAAVLAALLIPILAGCTAAPAGSPPAGVAAADLEPGRAYAFEHAGGSLSFGLDGAGDAAFELYGGDDARLGSVGFSAGTAGTGRHRLDGVAAGQLVLRLETLDGALRVESGGAPVERFLPLAEQVERVLLVDRPPRQDPVGALGVTLGGLQTDPANVRAEVRLARVPADLRVLGTGPWQDLHVAVQGARGLVLETEPDPVPPGGPVAPLGTPHALEAIPAAWTPQNLRDGALVAYVNATDLAGPIVLEARTYSRATLPSPGAPGPAPADAAFTYGTLPSGPASFAVHPSARHLYLWHATAAAGNGTGEEPAAPAAGGSDDEPGAVALFGSDDASLGVVLVPRSGSVAVPVSAGGVYVAVAVRGNATLGADRAPADFQLRGLDVTETVAPAFRAGDAGRYAIATVEVPAERAFALRPTLLPAPTGDLPAIQVPVGDCQGGRFLAVSQRGEGLFAAFDPGTAGPDPAPFLDGTLALRDGPLTVAYDGLGEDGCERLAVAVLSYQR